MQNKEQHITVGIVAIFGIMMLLKAIGKAFERAVTIGYDITNSISVFLSDFAPDWFWTFTIMTTTLALIIGLSLAIYQYISGLRYKSKIHEIKGRRAIVYHNDMPIAVSYGHDPIKRLKLEDAGEFTQAEIKILEKLARRQEKQFVSTSSNQNRHVIDCRKQSRSKHIEDKNITIPTY